MIQMTNAVKQLIIINVLFFVCTTIVGAPAFNILVSHFFKNPDFQLWQPVTYMFMHAGILHLLFNMMTLVFFGPALESRWGTGKFLFFYFSCGIGAFLLQQGINYYFFQDALSYLNEIGFKSNDVMQILNKGMVDTRWQENLSPLMYNNLMHNYHTVNLGASGAIYGILVAFAFLYPNTEMNLFLIPIPIKAVYFVMGIISIDIFMAFRGQSFIGTSTGVDHLSHLGGALVGYIMMRVWNKNQFNNNRWN